MKPSASLDEIRNTYVRDLSLRLRMSGKPSRIYPFVGINPEQHKFCALGNVLSAIKMASRGWLVYDRYNARIIASPETLHQSSVAAMRGAAMHESY